MSVKEAIRNFVFKPNGTTTHVDALCSFIMEEIAFGRIKGGDRFPTIAAICEATGLTFGRARRLTERLAREGYVCSRPHIGTVVLSRAGTIRGRVLFALPAEDTCRFHPSQLAHVLGHRLTAAGYAFSVATFPLDPKGDFQYLKSELLRATDLVVAARATPQVQKLLAESGVRHVFAYGDKPKAETGPWVRFAPEDALSHFADHCAKAGVKHVVQVRFEANESLDAGPALAERGVESSWLTVSRGEKGGRGRFDGVVQCAYETFAAMPRSDVNELFLFWNSFVAQGAIIAFLANGIRLPEDVKVVSFSDVGLGPVYAKSVTSLALDPIEAGETLSNYVLTILTKGRIPRPLQIEPEYVIGETFPLYPIFGS